MQIKTGLALASIMLGAAAMPAAASADGGYTVALSPASTAGGGTTTFGAAFSTGNGGQDLGSANLYVPSQFQVKSAWISGTAATVKIVGHEVEVTAINGSTKSFTLNVAATTPDNCRSQSYSWSSQAYTGPWDNGAALTDLSTPASEATTIANACSVAFAPGGEPADAQNNATITNTPYWPSGGPVQVDVLNGSGAIDSGYNGPVSVHLTPASAVGPGGEGTLGGTTTVNATNGVASFGNLTVSQPGNAYDLAATGPSGTAATSSSFDIHQAGTTCQASSSCSTELQSSDWSANTPGAIDASIGSPGGTYLGVTQPFAILSESIDFGNWPVAVRQAQCPTETDIGLHYFYGIFTDSAGNSVQRAFNATLVTRARLNDDIQNLIPGQVVCFASNHEFQEQTANNTLAPAPPATMPDGTAGYAGELPTCTNATGLNNPTFPTVDPNSGPCVSDREGVPASSLTGGTLTTKVTSPFDFSYN